KKDNNVADDAAALALLDQQANAIKTAKDAEQARVAAELAEKAKHDERDDPRFKRHDEKNVAALQDFLAKLGDEEKPIMGADGHLASKHGVFTEPTADAVRRYQQAYPDSLKATGNVDKNTLDWIASDAEAKLAMQAFDKDHSGRLNFGEVSNLLDGAKL